MCGCDPMCKTCGYNGYIDKCRTCPEGKLLHPTWAHQCFDQCATTYVQINEFECACFDKNCAYCNSQGCTQCYTG